MALVHAHFFSKILFQNVSAELILPQDEGRALPSSPLPTLWLLHGEGGDHTSWQRNTAIERRATERGIAVVMPAGEDGLWTDMRLGFRWFSFLSEELPATLRRFFPLSLRREENAVAGVGSGGYGALKLALSYPDRYCAAASFCGGNILAGPIPTSVPPRLADQAAVPPPWAADEKAQRKLAYACFGVEGGATVYDLPEAMGSAHDPFALAKAVAASDRRAPRIFLATGRDDPSAANFRLTRDFFGAFENDPFGLVALEPPGSRDWDLLDGWAVRFMDFAFKTRMHDALQEES